MRIKELLAERGMTMGELAEKAGMHQPEISRILTGNPTLATIEKIADALGVPTGELFEKTATNSFTCRCCGAEIEVKRREI